MYEGKLDLTNRLEANIFGEVEVSDGDRVRFFESKVENQDFGEFRMLVFEIGNWAFFTLIGSTVTKSPVIALRLCGYSYKR
ncbi:hypothetical protein C2G38_2154492 [Gigaspora rosea]|uniref:Uncharacterized protein n=1 Tax=Gigaspora rosea TaxID=44941 RepID=A0A397W6U3_9GLOM|nr:hypothetical protein C2G38_2154492 [Gigaspora rosea]